jgi:RND superfamily putative drug exporter
VQESPSGGGSREPSASPAEAPAAAKSVGFLVRNSRRVILAACFATVVTVLIGFGAQQRLADVGVLPASAESARADRYLTATFGSGLPDLVLIARADGSVDSAQAARDGGLLSARTALIPGVSQVVSYWSTRGADPGLRSKDGRAALVLVRLSGDLRQVARETARVVPEVSGPQGSLRVGVTGRAAVNAQIEQIGNRDLQHGGLFAVPLTALILVLVFRSVVAAALPLATGALAVLATRAALYGLAVLTPVSMMAMSVATALGFALCTDYSLFLVTRFREERARGRDVDSAVTASMATAGRAVAFSAATVALTLAALFVFDVPQLRSIAYGEITVAVFAGLCSLIVLPAMLTVLGRHIDRWGPFALCHRLSARRSGGGRPGSAPKQFPREACAEAGGLARLAYAVMRTPLAVAVSIVVLLLVLASPFLAVRFSLSDDRVLPPQSAAARTAAELRTGFDARSLVGAAVALPGLAGTGALGPLDAYARRVSLLPGVLDVDTATGAYARGQRASGPGALSAGFTSADGSWLSVTTVSDVPFSAVNATLADRLRALPSPVPALVTGPGEALDEADHLIGSRLRSALGLVAVAMLALVTALTGCPLLALKALVMNCLSLSATFGALVFVFQQGHLRWLVGDFTVTHTTDPVAAVLVLCVALAVSMDYEIILLSRITEEHESTGDTIHAVARGLQHTGRLFTSAALICAVSMLALADSGIILLKLTGVGVALAMLLDAFVVRSLLVPACMSLLGRLNWWNPWARDRVRGPGRNVDPALERT